MQKWIAVIRAALLAVAVTLTFPMSRSGAAALTDAGDAVVYSLALQSLQRRDFDQGYDLLLILEARKPGDRDLQILLAQLEIARKDIDAAIRRLKLLSASEPDWPRPRVELAKAYMAAERWREAKNILVAELGRDPPERVRRNIEQAVRAIDDRRTLVGRFSIGVAPDSNINNGSSASTIEYLGLPFSLSDEAKAQQGVRADISLGGTVRTAWRENTRLEASLDGYHSQPLGDEGVPDSNYRVELATRVRGANGSLKTGIAVQPYYFDGELDRTEAELFFWPVLRLTGRHYAVGAVTLTDGNVEDVEARDFRQWEISAGPSIGLGQTGRLQVTANFGRRNAEDDVFSFIRRGISLWAGASPWNGWKVSTYATITRDVYDDFNFPFGTRQEDLTREIGVSVARTAWVFFGVSPQIGVRWRETESTIDLYDRDSFAVTAGLTLPY